MVTFGSFTTNIFYRQCLLLGMLNTIEKVLLQSLRCGISQPFVFYCLYMILTLKQNRSSQSEFLFMAPTLLQTLEASKFYHSVLRLEKQRSIIRERKEPFLFFFY